MCANHNNNSHQAPPITVSKKWMIDIPDSVASGMPKNNAVTQLKSTPLGESPSKLASGFHIVVSCANPNKNSVKYVTTLTIGGSTSLEAEAKVDGSSSVTKRRAYN